MTLRATHPGPSLFFSAMRHRRSIVLAAIASSAVHLAAAASLNTACDALDAAALSGMSAMAAAQGPSLSDPNAVVLTPSDVTAGVYVGGQTAYLQESTIALADATPRRVLTTGGAYVSSAKQKTVGGIATCTIVGVIFPVSQTDPAVADPTYKAPNISFQLQLPLDWADRPDRKLIQFGGGLFNGKAYDTGILQSVNFMSGSQRPLANGYALASSDSGHRGENTLSFAKTPAPGYSVDQQVAVKNYAGESLKRLRDVSVTILNQLAALKPTRTYFAGISTGGREALKALHRFGADYDGGIAQAPAWDVTSGSAHGYGCDGLDYSSLALVLLLPTAPGATQKEKEANFCKMVALAYEAPSSLEALRIKGGKLLMVQGTADTVVPASKTAYYWNQFGILNAKRDEFARYYEISGYDHGSGYVPHFDLITTLDTWVGNRSFTPEAQRLDFVYADGTLGLQYLFLTGSYPVPPNQLARTPCVYPKQQSPQISAWNFGYAIYQPSSCI